MFPILLIAISAWAVAQGLKLLITTAVYRKFDISYLTSGGGMPSSHSALVCGAAVSCGMSAGFDSAVTPMLTTVHIPKEDMAHLAILTLRDRLEGGHRECLRLELPCHLMVRESAGMYRRS